MGMGTEGLSTGDSQAILPALEGWQYRGPPALWLGCYSALLPPGGGDFLSRGGSAGSPSAAPPEPPLSHRRHVPWCPGQRPALQTKPSLTSRATGALHRAPSPLLSSSSPALTLPHIFLVTASDQKVGLTQLHHVSQEGRQGKALIPGLIPGAARTSGFTCPFPPSCRLLGAGLRVAGG